jgi:hypothetical protein
VLFALYNLRGTAYRSVDQKRLRTSVIEYVLHHLSRIRPCVPIQD